LTISQHKCSIQNNIPLKSLYLVIKSNLTHLQGRNTEVKFKSRILERIYVGSETGSGSGSESLVYASSLLRSSVELFPHQRQALAWLLWRESQHPPGIYILFTRVVDPVSMRIRIQGAKPMRTASFFQKTSLKVMSKKY
jgi:hypothetical protein